MKIESFYVTKIRDLLYNDMFRVMLANGQQFNVFFDTNRLILPKAPATIYLDRSEAGCSILVEFFEDWKSS